MCLVCTRLVPLQKGSFAPRRSPAPFSIKVDFRVDTEPPRRPVGLDDHLQNCMFRGVWCFP